MTTNNIEITNVELKDLALAFQLSCESSVPGQTQRNMKYFIELARGGDSDVAINYLKWM
jgi:hypothetical protein